MFFAELALILIVSVGLGGLLPAVSGDNRLALGTRGFIGYCLLVLILFACVVPLSLGFGAALGVIIAAAAGGWLRITRTALAAAPGERPSTLEIATHPLVLLTVLVCAAGLPSSPLHFQPYGDDTYANWLSHAKQIWLVDGYGYPGMLSAGNGYPPGWQLMLALTAGMWGRFSDTLALVAPLTFHIVLLAMVFDVSVARLRRHAAMNAANARWAGMAIVLFLLAVEASWKLVPTLVLSEMPLFYSLIGFVVLASGYWDDRDAGWKLTLSLSIVLATHYLIKSQGMALVPVAMAMAALGAVRLKPGSGLRMSRRAAAGFAVIVPLAVCIVLWKQFGPISPKCNASTAKILSGGLQSTGELSVLRDLGIDMLGEIGRYLASYKVPVSLLALAGIAVSLFDRRLRWVGIAVLVYVVAYCAAVFTTYAGCPDGFNSYLSSLQRYLQLPVRLAHFVGVWLLALTAAGYVTKSARFWNLARRGVPAAAVALAAFQIYAAHLSFRTIVDPDIDPRVKVYVAHLPVETQTILREAKARGLERPKVLLAYVYWELLPYLIARHDGFPDMRAKLTPPPASGYSGAGVLAEWRLEHSRFETTGATAPAAGDAQDRLADFDVIWLRDPVGAVVRRLAPLIADAACREAPQDYFIIRKRPQADAYDCVKR